MKSKTDKSFVFGIVSMFVYIAFVAVVGLLCYLYSGWFALMLVFSPTLRYKDDGDDKISINVFSVNGKENNTDENN